MHEVGKGVVCHVLLTLKGLSGINHYNVNTCNAVHMWLQSIDGNDSNVHKKQKQLPFSFSPACSQ
jgi:hypothetical protein